MKKLLLPFLLTLSFLNCCFSQSSLDTVRKLGIISELVFMKYSSENYATRILNDSTISDNYKKQFVNLYQQTKITSDQVLIQLISDLKRKNSIRYFKKLDKLFTEKEFSEISTQDFIAQKLKRYTVALQILHTKHTNLLAFHPQEMKLKDLEESLSIEGFIPTTASLEELTGVLSFVTSTVKEIRETKEKKVEKISTVIESMRLEGLKNLIKQDKPEDNK